MEKEKGGKKLKSNNIELKEGYSQVCIWPACLVGNERIEEFTNFMKEEFDIKIQYLEEINTYSDKDNKGDNIPETGDRNDLFFAVHEEDIMKFAVPRFEYGIRWIEDVLSKGNYKSPIYPKRVFEYVTWNYDNLSNRR